MIKLKNSLQIKSFLRFMLILVILIQIVNASITLWDFFHKLVIEGMSTSSNTTETNFVVRILNFFQYGIGSVIKAYVLNICIPLLVYILLRDRDRDLLFGEDELDAIKEGVFEGVDEASTHGHIKQEDTDLLKTQVLSMINDNLKNKHAKKRKQTPNQNNNEVNNSSSLDSFFSTLEKKEDNEK